MRVVPAPCLAVLAAAALVAPGCGRSALEKAYDAYVAKVDPLLDSERPYWQRLRNGYRDVMDDGAALPRFSDLVRQEIRPYYAKFASDVDAIAPQDPALADAHEVLRRFAAKRKEFADTLAANLDKIAPSPAQEDLLRKVQAAQLAQQDYEAAIGGRTADADPRLATLHALWTTLQADIADPFIEGRTTAEAAQAAIRDRILGEIRRLEESAWADDEPSRRLRAAVLAAKELYTAWADAMPEMASRSRPLALANQAAVESEKAIDRDKPTDDFRTALAAVRKRM